MPISHEDLIKLVEEIKPYTAQVPRITTFELTTAIALLYYARQWMWPSWKLGWADV